MSEYYWDGFRSTRVSLSGVLPVLSSGLSPGPLLTLDLTQIIKHNRAEGIMVAISPMITDLPIILISC